MSSEESGESTPQSAPPQNSGSSGPSAPRLIFIKNERNDRSRLEHTQRNPLVRTTLAGVGPRNVKPAVTLSQYYLDRKGRRWRVQSVTPEYTPSLMRDEALAVSYWVTVAGYALVQLTDRYCKIIFGASSISDVAIVELTYVLADYEYEVGRPIFIFEGRNAVRRFEHSWAAIKYLMTHIKDKVRPPGNVGLSHLAEQLEAVVLIPSGEFQFHSERSLVAVGCGEVAGAAA
ncbi:MAG: hypothetical protein ACKVP7_06315, partial [Hyphomicrobiaceae bacterium]